MDTIQIILLGLVALIIAIRVRKYFLSRSLSNYSAREVSEKIKTNKNVILLDVRTDVERKGNYIKGSIHIPLHQLKMKADELSKYKGKEIICYCQSGSRSISAAVTLTKMGFNAANMLGGISAWNY